MSDINHADTCTDHATCNNMIDARDMCISDQAHQILALRKQLDQLRKELAEAKSPPREDAP